MSKSHPLRLAAYRCYFYLLPVVCCLFLASCQSTPPPQGVIVKVERAISGQMVEVVETGNQLAASEKVRLIGIDAPDLKQEPWGLAARDYLQQLIGDRSVLLESDEEPKDEKYERRFGYLWSDRTLLNEQLILQGYALFAARSPNNKYDQRLVRAQEFARIMERGIWNHQKPMRLSPAEFRRQYR